MSGRGHERHPPGLTRTILRAAVPERDRATLPAELDELFRERVRSSGRLRARWWYRRQVGRFVLGLVAYRLDRHVSSLLDPRLPRELLSMDALARDLRYSIRRFARSPGFTLVALVSLALGIGANTAIFSLVNSVLLRDRPLDDAEELVEVYQTGSSFSHSPLSYPDYVDVRDGTAGLFEGVAASRLGLAQLNVDESVEMLLTEQVTGNYFTVQGVGAAVGRTLLPEDDVSPGSHPVVALGHGYWQRVYGRDPGVVGRELRLAGRPYQIVGVIEEEYPGNLRGIRPDIYVPAMMVGALQRTDASLLEARDSQGWFTKARLADGVSLAEAQAALERMAEGFRRDYPDQWTARQDFALVPTEDVIVNPAVDGVLVPAMGLLLGVAGIVLLIACANLASFLLARAADRKKEIALRLALGARRWVLIRQLLTETILLGLAAGALGLLLAHGLLTTVMTADLPLPLPVDLDLGLDRPVLLFTAGVSLLAGVLFGLAPAIQATNPDVAPTLKNEVTGGRARTFSLRNVLVAGQVALSLVLLVGAGLTFRSLEARLDVDPGFGTRPAALVSVRAPADRYETDEETRAFMRELTARIAALPGVESVGKGTDIHLNLANSYSVRVRVPGVEPPAGEDFFSIDQAAVDRAYFDAMAIDLEEGRLFDDRDVPGGQRVVVVNRAFAERFWPGRSAVSRTVVLDDEEATVVGVVETARIRTLGEDDRPFVYEAASQEMGRYAWFVAATSGDPRRTVTEIIRTAQELEPAILLGVARTMERHLAIMMLPHRLSSAVAGVFALLALTLASIGLYGVVSYAVAKRAREVGIRMSLGADGSRVVRMLMADGLKLVLAGGAVGMVLAVLFARTLSSFLYGVQALDPVTFLGVPLTLLAVATLAAWMPARKVANVSPVRSLRADG